MRFFIAFLFISLFGSASFAQSDSSKTLQAPVERRILIPGVNTPVSGPGMTAQVPVNPAPELKPGEKEPKILPPSDPRSFGISIPFGKTKKDTLR